MWSASAAISEIPKSLRSGAGTAPSRPSIACVFAQTALWPDYDGPPGDTIDLELYEHWLEPATE